MPVFHSRGVAGIVQRSVDSLNVRHVAEQPIGIGIRHDLHTVTGDDQGPIVFQPCDNGFILRGRNVPHVIVLFHQSASIAWLHIGDRIVPAGILEHNALDLGPVFRSVEVHIAVVIRCQGRCIQRLGHTVSGPGIVIAPNNRRHTPLIRNPVIALRNGVFSHDLGRHIGVYIEGARGASRSGEGNVGLGRLVKGDLRQLIDMSEGHGIKVGQRRRQRQRRNTDIIEGPLPYRHQALRQRKAGYELEIGESVVTDGRHALHKGQPIRLILIVGPFRARSGGEVLHGAFRIIVGKLELDTVLAGCVLVCQIAHKGFAVLVGNRGSSPADPHLVIKRTGGIQSRAVKFLGEVTAIHPNDYLFKGKFDTSRRLKGRRDGQGQVSCLILRSGRQHMCRQVEGNGLLVRADVIGNIRAANRELCVIRSTGVSEDRQPGIRGHPGGLHGNDAVDVLRAGIAFFQRGSHVFTGTKRPFRRHTGQRIAFRAEAGGGELHGAIHAVGEECQRRNADKGDQRQDDGDNTFSTDTLRHLLLTSFLLRSIIEPLPGITDPVYHHRTCQQAHRGDDQPCHIL